MQDRIQEHCAAENSERICNDHAAELCCSFLRQVTHRGCQHPDGAPDKCQRYDPVIKSWGMDIRVTHRDIRNTRNGQADKIVDENVEYAFRETFVPVAMRLRKGVERFVGIFHWLIRVAHRECGLMDIVHSHASALFKAHLAILDHKTE